MEEVRSGSSFGKTATKWRVKKTTLHDHLSKRVKSFKKSALRTLSKSEEEYLASWVRRVGKKGCPAIISQILDGARKLLQRREPNARS